jgi:hypothetical protein
MMLAIAHVYHMMPVTAHVIVPAIVHAFVIVLVTAHVIVRAYLEGLDNTKRKRFRLACQLLTRLR